MMIDVPSQRPCFLTREHARSRHLSHASVHGGHAGDLFSREGKKPKPLGFGFGCRTHCSGRRTGSGFSRFASLGGILEKGSNWSLVRTYKQGGEWQEGQEAVSGSVFFFFFFFFFFLNYELLFLSRAQSVFK